MDNPKPVVVVACICEKVLQEKDGVNSLIRIVDTFHVTLPEKELPAGVNAAISLTLYVSLRSEDVTGRHEVGLVLHGPSGEKDPEVRKWPVLFMGGEHTSNMVVEMILTRPELGQYWFDVTYDGEILTRIRLQIKQQAEQPTSAN